MHSRSQEAVELTHAVMATVQRSTHDPCLAAVALWQCLAALYARLNVETGQVPEQLPAEIAEMGDAAAQLAVTLARQLREERMAGGTTTTTKQ